MSILSQVDYWRERYTSAGLQTIPLQPHLKIPMSGESWLYTPAAALWNLAPNNANLAVPMGQPVKRGTLAALDGDNPETARNLAAWLAGKGLDLATVPQVSTPTKSGRHFYVATTPPDWYTWGNLAPDVGAGELRVNHCYVLAPASVVEAGIYQFVNGDPGALEFAPFVRWEDLLDLFPPQLDPATGQPTETHKSIQAPATFPIRLIRRDPPARAFQVFDNLAATPKGNPVPMDDSPDPVCYPSRSEAEFAICIMLALAGWEWEDVYREFARRNVGKFSDKGQGKKYLKATYQNAVKALAANETRRSIALAYETVKAQPWPGRVGLSNLATLKALYAVMWQFATLETRASIRDLAIHAGITKDTANKAIRRLVEAGYIDFLDKATPRTGRNFRAKTDINHNIGHGEETQAGTPETERHALAELFTAANYGKSAGAMVEALTGGEALTVAALAERTGKHAGTVRKAVKRLADYGILIRDGEEKTRGRLSPRYKLAPEKLTEWAEKWDTGAQLARRRERIAEERERYQERQQFSKKTPAKRPQEAPRTPQDKRNEEKRENIAYTPKWAQPAHLADWLNFYLWQWAHEDTNPYEYMRQIETRPRHEPPPDETDPAVLAWCSQLSPVPF